MRVLVTGANGQVGWELARKGNTHGFEMAAFDRAALDIANAEAVRSEIAGVRPNLVINAAAYTAVDRAESEPDLAFSVNRDGPAHLAASCAKAGIPLIHISTDYVFDGTKKDPYLEADPISPIGVYGKSKAAGEEEIRACLKEHIILRTAWVYGVHGRNFVKTMLRMGQEQETIRVVSDQYGCPTYAADIADAILTITSRLMERGRVPWGTYHYCGNGITTWYGFAERILDLARQHGPLAVKNIEPITTAEYPTSAKRPANSILDCSLVKENFGIHPVSWQTGLANMIRRLFSSKLPFLGNAPLCFC